MTSLNAPPNAPPTESQALLERLRAEHRSLKQRVAELESHRSLTPEEQAECIRLKKLKLATKDEIFRLEAARH